MTDEELAEACKRGDDNAFHELMNRHMGHILNFVRQYARAPEDAEDIAQDAFFKAWKHIRRFTAGKKWKPWMFMIARNTALDHLKKKRTATFSELNNEDSDLEFADTLPDPEPLPADIFERKELAGTLAAALSRVHPDHGAVIVMHYHLGMTFDEIAISLGKPMNTVKSWHRRVLIKLRTILNGQVVV